MKRVALAALVLILVLVGGAWLALRMLLAPERVRATVETQASAALGAEVRIGSASARLFPNVGLELSEITISGTPTRLESVSIETGLRPLFSRRVEDAQITVTDGRVEIPWLVALLASMAQAPVPPPGSSPAISIVSIRTIELRSVALTAGRHELRVDVDGLFQQDRLEVSRLEARGEGSTFSATGALDSLAKVTGAFTVTADTLNLDGLLALASAATPSGQSRAAPGPSPDTAKSSGLSIVADLKAASGRVASFTFTDLATRMRVTSGGVELRPLSLRAFDGRFNGRADVNTTRAVPETIVSGDASGIDVAAVSAFVGAAKNISGRLTGRANVSCACVDLDGALSGLQGAGQFVVVDGAIPGLQIVRTAVLAFGRPAAEAPAGSGEAFSRIGSSFTMRRGSIATPDLTFASRDFDMRGAGTLSVTSGALAYKADVVLSRELSRQAGRDLYRYAREGDRIILPATISGTLGSPRVFIDASQALQRALKNELERRGRSLLDRFLRRKP